MGRIFHGRAGFSKLRQSRRVCVAAWIVGRSSGAEVPGPSLPNLPALSKGGGGFPSRMNRRKNRATLARVARCAIILMPDSFLIH